MLKLVGNGVTVPPIRSTAPPASASVPPAGLRLMVRRPIEGAVRHREVSHDGGVGGQGLRTGAADHQVPERQGNRAGDRLRATVELDRARSRSACWRRIQMGGVRCRRLATSSLRRCSTSCSYRWCTVKPFRSKVPDVTVRLPVSAALASNVLVNPAPLTVRFPYTSPATDWLSPGTRPWLSLRRSSSRSSQECRSCRRSAGSRCP